MGLVTDYILKSYKEKYSRWGDLVKSYIKDGKLNYSADMYPGKKITYGPGVALDLFQKRNILHALSPVKNNLTNLIWFDIDSHGVTNPELLELAFETGRKIVAALQDLGITAEFAQSSSHGNYHICIWSKAPQGVRYCQKVQRTFINSLNLDSRISIDVGPGRGMKLRPWFMGNSYKPAGVLFQEGVQVKDFSCFLKFYTPDFKSRPVKFNLPLDLTNCIPDGVKLKRNAALLKLVRQSKLRGYDLDQIKALAIDIYNKGVVHDSLETHLAELDRVLGNYKELGGKKGIWKVFWERVSPKLAPYRLLQEAAKFAEFNGLGGIILTWRAVAEYYGVSRRQAANILESLMKQGYLKMLFRGKWKRGSVYLFIKEVSNPVTSYVGRVWKLFFSKQPDYSLNLAGPP